MKGIKRGREGGMGKEREGGEGGRVLSTSEGYHKGREGE